MSAMPVARIALPAIIAIVVASVLLFAGGTQQNAYALHDCQDPSTSGTSNTEGGGGLMAPTSLADMTEESDAVVAGTVLSMQACVLNSGDLVTLVFMSREFVLKAGDATAAEIVTVAVPGGDFGDYRLHVGTSPEFAVGERSLVFLAEYGGPGLMPTAGYNSKLKVSANDDVPDLGLSLQTLQTLIAKADAGTLSPADDPIDGFVPHDHAYSKSGPKWATEEVPLPLYVNSGNGKPGQLTNAETTTAIANAAHSWQNVAGSFIAFGPIGQTSRTSTSDGCSFFESPDGYNDVTWKIDGPHPSSTLAVTKTCYSLGTNTYLDTDIEIDTDHFGDKWVVSGNAKCGSGKFDLETVMLHEIGHLFGLNHPTSNGCPNGTDGGCPVMNAAYLGRQQTPCADDQNGARAVYPSTGLVPSNPPANFGAASYPPNVELHWDDVPDETATEVFRAGGPCADAEPADFSLHDTVDNDVTEYTDSNYGLGLPGGQTFCYKVRSINLGGESGFSEPFEATQGAPTPTPKPLIKGDNDCDDDVDTMDSLLGFLHIASAAPSQPQGCPLIGSGSESVFGDMDCDSDVDAFDNLMVVQHGAGLAMTIPDGCAPIGTAMLPG